MAKNLKLNIKNLQLAGAFKPRAPKKEEEPAEKLRTLKEEAASAKEASVKEEGGIVQKRRARIVQSPKEKEAAAAQETPPPAPAFSVQEEETPASPSLQEEKAAPEAASPAVQASAAPLKKAEPSSPGSHTSSPPPPAPRKDAPAKDTRFSHKKKAEVRTFDGRDRQGLRDIDNEAWRKRRAYKQPRRSVPEELIIRPKHLSVRLPITIKDLAQEMKLKASQLVAKLFMQGITLTLNDLLDDETVVQLLGHEFDCKIEIDRSEEQRIQITDQTIKEEIEATSPDVLALRPPVVTFMGHVDHGKTSLIDAIRKSNRVAGEAGAITQHIGAFKVKTAAGDVTILDTPGHEAFSEMRSRGANVTDIVILVVAGDEGIRKQTEEAMKQAQDAGVPILVAINKSDKAGFDEQKIYRELSDRQLLPEAWGGTTITVNCSAVTGAGIKELLEMIALQAEILELRANANTRARGTVLESEMHKGMGAVATVLIQNGTLKHNDAIVFGPFSGRVKTMHDEFGKPLSSAGPSTPVKITGLSELAEAGSEFIVVKNEKEARALAEARAEGAQRRLAAQAKLGSLEKMMAKKASGELKILPLILRADVQGSLEALRTSLMKIQSSKVRLEIVSADVGEISESDIALAAASKATILGFHTSIERHAEDEIKQKGVAVFTHDVIYHILDEVKVRMRSLLDKLEEEKEMGVAQVRAVFKSSQLGLIAGCQVEEGLIKRGSLARLVRGKEVIWKGKIASLKRLKEDVKEVKEGFECGILLEGRQDVQEGDRIQAYEIIYIEQDL